MEVFSEQPVLFLPIYVYGFATELVKVNLDEEEISTKFTFYVTLMLDITNEHVKMLRSKEYFEFPEE